MKSRKGLLDKSSADRIVHGVTVSSKKFDRQSPKDGVIKKTRAGTGAAFIRAGASTRRSFVCTLETANQRQGERPVPRIHEGTKPKKQKEGESIR